jgi:hypothetical protein
MDFLDGFIFINILEQIADFRFIIPLNSKILFVDITAFQFQKVNENRLVIWFFTDESKTNAFRLNFDGSKATFEYYTPSAITNIKKW